MRKEAGKVGEAQAYRRAMKKMPKLLLPGGKKEKEEQASHKLYGDVQNAGDCTPETGQMNNMRNKWQTSNCSIL